MSNIVNLQSLTPEPKAHSFVDTIPDKLHQLRHDDKSKSGKFLTSLLKCFREIYQKYSSVGSVHHPLVTVTPSPLAQINRPSAESSPSHSYTHSQISRNSSRKSNNSLTFKIDGM